LKRHADTQTAADLSRQTSPEPVVPPAKQPASTNKQFFATLGSMLQSVLLG
jgi:hypothetical protein